MSQDRGESSDSSRNILRGTSIVGLLTLLSRILGFVRDMVLAMVFGAGVLTDAFVVAFRIPNLLRSMFAEGAMTSAFVPVFCGELARGRNEARQAIRSVTGLLLALTLLLSLLGIIFARELVSAISPGYLDDPSKFELCIRLTRIMLPYIVFVSLVALVGGALNAVRIFGMPAVSQVVMNITLISGALLAALYDPLTGMTVLAISVIAGGLAQVAIQLPALRRAGLSIWPSWNIFSAANRQVLALLLPAVIGANIYQVAVFLSTLLASMLADGSQSWFFFADRLVQFPIGTFSVALASVLLPTLAMHAARKEEAAFGQGLSNSLRYTSFFMIPAAFLMFYLAEPLVVLLFERGAFDRHSSIMTSLAVQAMALGLWSLSCNSLLKSAFIARKDTVTPTLAGLFTLLVNIPLAILLMGPVTRIPDSTVSAVLAFVRDLPGLSWLAADFRHAGLGLASSSAYLLTSFLLLSLLHRRIGVDLREFRLATLRSLISSMLMIAALYWLVPHYAFAHWQQILLALPLGALVYLAASRLLGSCEVPEIARLISSRILKK